MSSPAKVRAFYLGDDTTAAKTSILAKFIRDRLDLSRMEGTSLAA
jgi:hypothetical protein